MAAGHSAATEAALFTLEAEGHEYRAITARQMARNYAIAASSERALADALAPLEDRGFTVLSDRAWPGSANAQVDFVLVGPSGVCIVDAKHWGEVRVVADRVFQGQDDVTDRFDAIASLTALVQEDLVEIGVAPGEVRAAAVFTNRNGTMGRTGPVDLMGVDKAFPYLLGRGERLSPADIDRVRQRLELLFPPHLAQPRAAASALPPVIPITREAALVTVEELEASLLAFELAKPIEEWMAFLHPDQARIARRSYSGPSRIRGSAGTGKTVVGLHRAAHIARTRPGKVLVTTFVRTLPDVLASLMERMAPEVADRVEFMGVHEFARRTLKDRGIRFKVDREKAELLFERAWRDVGANGPLAGIDPNSKYWQEEISCVIKGRGISRWEQYADLSRVGRKRGLGAAQRHAVWQLFVRYEALMRSQDVSDDADLILRANLALQSEPDTRWSAVVVDEAQDLSCAMIRMLHQLVADTPDGLNLIGDGQQTIYPGGYTLGEIGISIAGRGVVMTRNYRNTAQIALLAATLIAGDVYADIEGDHSLPDLEPELMRRGVEPTVTQFASRPTHDQALVAHVQELVRTGCRLGDIGILAPHTFATRDIHAALDQAGIPSIDLLSYRGKSTGEVKVGTIKRAKGLEFTQVLVARVPGRLLVPDTSAETDDAARERRELELRELYVAMTRARDGLWVGAV